MKQFLAAATFALMTSCATQTPQNATVTRDCTGTYLRIAAKDYLVCNTDLLKNYKEGSTVSANYEKVENCPEFKDKVACMMYHEKAGIIRIKSVK